MRNVCEKEASKNDKDCMESGSANSLMILLSGNQMLSN